MSDIILPLRLKSTVSYFPLESACQKSRIAPLIGLHVKKFKTWPVITIFFPSIPLANTSFWGEPSLKKGPWIVGTVSPQEDFIWPDLVTAIELSVVVVVLC